MWGGKADELSMVESDGTVNYFETFKKEQDLQKHKDKWHQLILKPQSLQLY